MSRKRESSDIERTIRKDRKEEKKEEISFSSTSSDSRTDAYRRYHWHLIIDSLTVLRIYHSDDVHCDEKRRREREKEKENDDDNDELNRLRKKQTKAKTKQVQEKEERHRSSARCFFSLRTMFLLHYRHLSHYLSDNIDNDTITLKTARKEKEIRMLF